MWFQYSPDRKGERPRTHLKDFSGILQADSYAGFDAIYASGRVSEAAYWAHARRKYFDLLRSDRLAAGQRGARARIGALYEIEKAIRGKPADERRRVRQDSSLPKLLELHHSMQKTLAATSAKSDLAKAILYSLKRWAAFTRYADDGRIEMDNNAAERDPSGPPWTQELVVHRLGCPRRSRRRHVQPHRLGQAQRPRSASLHATRDRTHR